MDDLIVYVKQHGISDTTLELWYVIENILFENHVDEIIIACTDISFCRDYVRKNMTYYDSSKILAESLVKFYISERSIF